MNLKKRRLQEELHTPIPIRLTKSTVQELAKDAQDFGMPLSTYIRLIVEQQHRKQKQEHLERAVI